MTIYLFPFQSCWFIFVVAHKNIFVLHVSEIYVETFFFGRFNEKLLLYIYFCALQNPQA